MNNVALPLKPEVPEFVVEYVGSCPSAGAGVHNWLFRVARMLHPYYDDKAEIRQLITSACCNCGRDVPEGEIDDAIVNSGPDARGADGARTKPWPRQGSEQIAKAIAAGPDLSGLRDLSPARYRDGRPHSEEIIDLLFPGNPLLCLAENKRKADTRLREQWRGFMAETQFIVPSPMISPLGRTKNGKTSRRCLENTGPRRFLVVEFDPPKWSSLSEEQMHYWGREEHYYAAQRDEHAALHFHLGTYAPLTLVVHSGGKSLHGWYFCAGVEETTVNRFMRYAVSLGADPMTWTRCQLVRLPDGMRDNGNRQEVIYFNPSTIK